jgi:membrane protein implicated in regulation of membrane protease activity
MYPTELVYIIICTILILLSSFLPTGILLLLDNIIVRIALVFLLLYVVRVGSTAAIIVFMTIAILYLERNRRKVEIARKKLDAMEVPKHASVKEAYKKTVPVEVPEFDMADGTETDFLPHETREDQGFEPVDVTINQKSVLSTIYPLDERTDELYEKMGFGHVDEVETVM